MRTFQGSPAQVECLLPVNLLHYLYLAAVEIQLVDHTYSCSHWRPSRIPLQYKQERIGLIVTHGISLSSDTRRDRFIAPIADLSASVGCRHICYIHHRPNRTSLSLL